VKTLLLIRHAEAGWGAFGESDISRTLTERGIKQVHHIASQMLGKAMLPDKIISSTAKRAEMTAQTLATDLSSSMENIQWHDDLYLAESNHLLTTAMQADDTIQALAIIAHNPGLSELAHSLLSGAIEGMSPADVVAIRWEVDHWQDIATTRGTLQTHLYAHI
jgi:phosphohistidine phosphatase